MTPAATKTRDNSEPTQEVDMPVLQFVEEPPAPEQFNVLLYGPAGSGKSTAAATSPSPILWVNAEGPNALAYARKTAAERAGRILEVRLDHQATPDVRQTLREVIRYARDGRDPQIATVVVDTLAKVREALIQQLVVPGAKNSLQQYGDVAKALGGFVRTLRDLPVNVILIAHEDVADVDGDRIIRPLIGGALTETIPGEVDVMAYCAVHREENKVSYLGQLIEGRGRRAKDRSGGLGVVRSLDMSEWLGTYREALGVTPVPWEDGFEELPDDDHGALAPIPDDEFLG